MAPFLEGYLWPDVHHELASSIKEIIVPQISPKYVARINLYTVNDTSPEEDIGVMYPDVEVLHKKNTASEPAASYTTGEKANLTPATLKVPSTEIIEVRIPVVEILDTKKNQLITAIEILSPVNKRNPGLLPYREKRQQLHRAGVHLLEIDLLRRGKRSFEYPYLPKSHYLAALWRAESGQTDVWTFTVKEPLPVLPIPLKAPDPDVQLNLKNALKQVYERSRYHLSIDYQETPPPPAFTEEEQQWLRELLKIKGMFPR